MTTAFLTPGHDGAGRVYERAGFAPTSLMLHLSVPDEERDYTRAAGVRKETQARHLTATLLTLALLAAATASVAGATSPNARDLPVSDLFTRPGHVTKLTAKATYHASKMPIEVRFTTPDRSWAGAQWKANAWTAGCGRGRSAAFCGISAGFEFASGVNRRDASPSAPDRRIDARAANAAETQRAACVSRWKQAALVPLESAYDLIHATEGVAACPGSGRSGHGF